MADLQHMSRVLYHHDWADVQDWARNVDQLADLSDDEIGKLPDTGNEARGYSVDGSLAVAESDEQLSLLERTKQSLIGFCETLRYGFRRTC